MKAIVYTEYGSPDVLQFKEIEKPTPKEDEILIKVHASSINAADWRFMRATPFFARADAGLFKPKSTILGFDVAGQVEEVGRNVTKFKSGDEVFGEISQSGLGAFAEYVCVRKKDLVLKPTSVTFEEAASLPVAGLTALQSLRDKGQIQAGQKVLINGASGAVGTFTVQIAKMFGAEVTGVCSTQKIEQTQSIGADHVIDYTQEDFTQNGQNYDLLIDNVGNFSVRDYQRLLSSTGTGVGVGFTTMLNLLKFTLQSAWVSRRGSQKIGHMGSAILNQKDLQFLGELLETGKIKSVIDRRYPLHEVATAIRYIEEGHACGKVVINVEHNNK